MAAPALVALAHGSRDPRSAATIKALVAEVKAMRPDLRIETAFLDLSKPSLRHGRRPPGEGRLTTRSSSSRCCSRRPTTRRSTCRRRSPRPWPATRASASRPAGSSAWRPPSSRCSTSACARRSRPPGCASSTPWCSPPPARPTRSPTRRSPASPARGARGTGCPSPRPSPRPLPRPPARPCAPSAREGKRHIAVASFFLAPGRLPDRATELAVEAGAVAVSDPLGRAPRGRPRDPRPLRRGRGRARPGVSVSARCLSASRRESPLSRSAWVPTKVRTHAGSVRACCRSAQPSALRTKNSRPYAVSSRLATSTRSSRSVSVCSRCRSCASIAVRRTHRLSGSTDHRSMTGVASARWSRRTCPTRCAAISSTTSHQAPVRTSCSSSGSRSGSSHAR